MPSSSYFSGDGNKQGQRMMWRIRRRAKEKGTGVEGRAGEARRGLPLRTIESPADLKQGSSFIRTHQGPERGVFTSPRPGTTTPLFLNSWKLQALTQLTL